MKWFFEIWYDGCCITEDSGYETEEDAQEMAEEVVESYLEDWTDTTREDYDVRVNVSYCSYFLDT